MHLYLSSYRIGDRSEQLRDWLQPGSRVAIIGNARDQLSGEERETRMQQEHVDLQSLGFVTQEVDLRDFFDRPAAEVAAVLSTFQMLWCRGGNTFLLRQALALSGAEDFLRTRLDDPNFVYGGYSAGACVLSPSLEGIHLADDPAEHPLPYPQEPRWDGLGFIQYFIVPHYRSDHFESALMESVVQYYRERHLPFRTLQDGEVIIDQTH